MDPKRIPSIVINRETKEVTYNHRLSDCARIDFLAPIILRMAMQEQSQKTATENK